MSEALSQGPESLGPQYAGGTAYPSSEPHLTHLSVHEASHGEYSDSGTQSHIHASKVAAAASGLPPFSSFGGPEPAAPTSQFAGNGGPEGLSGRLLDISSWDYYGEGLSGRLLEQRSGGVPPGAGLGGGIGGGGDILLGPPPPHHPHHPHHPQFPPHQHHSHHHQLLLQQQHPQQYRPWESKGEGVLGGDLLLLKGGIPNFTDAFGGGPRLPSFQSQFNATYGPESGETDGSAAPPPPGTAPCSAPGLPSFHTLGPAATVPTGPQTRYPLVPAPVQAREVPSIQQQFVDERHIHLFHGQPPFPSGPPSGPISGPPSGQYPPPSHSHAAPPVVLAKAESSADSEHYGSGNGPQRGQRAPSGATGKLGESRKKERRKARGHNSGTASGGADSAESSAQVAAVSSTAPEGNATPEGLPENHRTKEVEEPEGERDRKERGMAARARNRQRKRGRGAANAWAAHARITAEDVPRAATRRVTRSAR